ncbi:NTP/NDP exchange transporter [Lysobacter yangpyeongensis]|uniref:NTP/NDP exchange transporter n=1 Tax=Lysobacter yangpyeongensis TaxID=346182 RepID=A0ABW0SLB4_9GAMM
MGTIHDAGVAARRIHLGEWRAVLLSFVYFFCVLAAYYILRPVREQLFAAVGGSTNQTWFYATVFVATLGLTPLFSALASRYPRRVIVPVVYAFFIVCLFGFIPFFTYEGLLTPYALGVVFFVWVSVFNLFVVAVFWSFMADIWDEEQARRLFPIIALGGTAGAVSGPALTQILVARIGVAPLLVVSACLLMAATACAVLLGRWARTHGARRFEVGHEAAVGGSMWDGLKQVFANPFVRGMSLLLLLGDGIGTINYALVADYAKGHFADAVARTRFFGGMDLTTNTLQVVLQLTVTRWLLPRSGAGLLIALWGLGVMVVLLLVYFAADPYGAVSGITQAQAAASMAGVHGGSFVMDLVRSMYGFFLLMPWVALALVVSRALAYGLVGPARESLFSMVPRSVRYKGKNAVDTAVWRFGDLSVASIMDGLRGFGVGIAGFSLLAASWGALATAVGWRLADIARRENSLPAHQVGAA